MRALVTFSYNAIRVYVDFWYYRRAFWVYVIVMTAFDMLILWMFVLFVMYSPRPTPKKKKTWFRQLRTRTCPMGVCWVSHSWRHIQVCFIPWENPTRLTSLTCVKSGIVRVTVRYYRYSAIQSLKERYILFLVVLSMYINNGKRPLQKKQQKKGDRSFRFWGNQQHD